MDRELFLSLWRAQHAPVKAQPEVREAIGSQTDRKRVTEGANRNGSHESAKEKAIGTETAEVTFVCSAA